ncbi:MFS transporter [Bordetella genomosp. 8]|uniref:MFS transporter n=1 Tax=Bordetella genomosp. 8 TaxID=1416806 RepID=A0A1W6YN19_9BORD|nr:tripartite tricarboxylate transporter substrate binding protein [Bordetella genomosp. 8]ARP81933.1 MFS transporter [Bordetella genomosp. 8]
MYLRIKRGLGVLLATCSLTLAHAAWAEFPEKPLRLIVGYVPGGSADSIARLFAQELGARLKQPVIVENKPGASGNIAATYVSRAAPDGYVMFLGSNATATNMTLYKNLTYDLERDLAPVALLSRFPNVVAVSPKLPVNNIGEFIAYAKAHPGAINFASSGSGSSTHLAGELFASMTGIKMTHVPYKGSAPALTDMMAGQVDVMFDNAPSIYPYVKSGKVRGLAVSSVQRQAFAPDLPTVADTVPGYEVTSWYGLFVPAHTPDAVVEKLNGTLNDILREPTVREKLAFMYAEPAGGSVAQFKTFVGQEIQRWGALVKQSGAHVD